MSASVVGPINFIFLNLLTAQRFGSGVVMGRGRYHNHYRSVSGQVRTLSGETAISKSRGWAALYKVVIHELKRG